MSDMITFSVQMLGALSDFLASEPIFYLFGLVLSCFVVKIFMLLVRAN